MRVVKIVTFAVGICVYVHSMADRGRTRSVDVVAVDQRAKRIPKSNTKGPQSVLFRGLVVKHNVILKKKSVKLKEKIGKYR